MENNDFEGNFFRGDFNFLSYRQFHEILGNFVKIAFSRDCIIAIIFSVV